MHALPHSRATAPSANQVIMPLLNRKNENREAAREAYLQLAAAADEFEQYANPHAVRIAAIADAIAETFHLAPQDRRRCARPRVCTISAKWRWNETTFSEPAR